MTKKPSPPQKTPDDPVAVAPTGAAEEAIARALEAASAATDAAHEAEAVLAARSEAALALDRTARRSGLLAALAGGAAVLVLGLGGLLWLRSSADLHEAAEVQAAASVAFVERLGEMNRALDRLDQIVIGLDAESQAVQSRLAALVEELGAGVQEIRASPAAAASDPGSSDPATSDPALSAQIDQLRADLIEAIAETQISISERLLTLSEAVAATAPPAMAASPVAAPARSASKPARKPAPRPAAPRQAPNPFRYP